MSKGLPRASHHYPDATVAYGHQAGAEDAKEGKPSRAEEFGPGRYRDGYERGYRETSRRVKP